MGYSFLLFVITKPCRLPAEHLDQVRSVDALLEEQKIRLSVPLF